MIAGTLGNTDYIIHHPSKVDVYAVTREQLELISQTQENEWKGYFQNALSVMLTSVINVLALGWKPDAATFSLNFGLGVLALVVAAISILMMYREGHKRDARLTEILKQPVQSLRVEEEALELSKNCDFDNVQLKLKRRYQK